MPTARTPRTEAGHAARRTRRRRVTIALGITATVLAAAGIGVWAMTLPRSAPAAPTVSADISPEPTVTVEPTAAIEPTTPPVPSGPATITVAAVGDMQFDRQVKRLIDSSGGTAPLAQVAAELASAVITSGNLESPLSTRGTRQEDKQYTFRGDPRAAEGLNSAGFDFLSLANNHALDCGRDALSDTISLLDRASIGHSGAGMNSTEAWAPSVRDVN